MARSKTKVLAYGELFGGYGGLGRGVQSVLGTGRLAWYSDVCKFDKHGNAGHHSPHRAPCSILAHHYPDVPNLGDITKIDWPSIEPVDVMTGGSPCQDLSSAGRRAGMTEGTRSNLWVAMREGIAILRPRLVIWENVRGAYSAAADSDLEHCEGCMGDRRPEPALRALGRVLGDLSDIGYDAAWIGLRASEVGACHGRFRVILGAWPRDDLSIFDQLDAQVEGGLTFGGPLLPTPTVKDTGDYEGSPADFERRQAESATSPSRGPSLGVVAQRQKAGALLSTPQSHDAKGTPSNGFNQANLNRDVLERMPNEGLLPTPRAAAIYPEPVEQIEARGFRAQNHLPSVVAHLLPTPVVSDTQEPVPEGQRGRGYGAQLRDVAAADAPLLPTPNTQPERPFSEEAGNLNLGQTLDLLPTLTDAVRELGDDEHAPDGSALLPTPNPFHMGNTESPDEWLERRADVEQRTGTRHGPALAVVAQSVLEGAPLVQDGDGPKLVPAGSDRWGPYAAAVHRHELVVASRPVPDPTEPGRDGKPRLSARFPEWMMGLPDGWVTDVPEIKRAEALKAIGNGVVPQQAAEATRRIFAAVRAARAMGMTR